MRGRFLPALLATLLAVAMSSCASSAAKPSRDASGQTKLTVLLDWTPNTNHSGIYIAAAKGWYAKAGLDVRIIQPGQNSDAMQMLSTGKADFAISTEEELTPAVAKGLPVESVAAILQHNTSGFVSLKSEGITRPRDLVGKKYASFGGQLEKALVDSLVRCDGGNPATIKFVNVGDSDYRVGLTKHFYDFAWTFDGWEGIQFSDIDHLAINEIRLADHTKCIPDWYTPLIATRSTLAHKDPSVVRRFMTATRQGYQDAIAHPADAVSALEKAAPQLDKTLVTKSAAYMATHYTDDPARWGWQDKSVWTSMTKFLTANRIIDGKVDVNTAFSNAFLGEK